jgi:hypothetical protein
MVFSLWAMAALPFVGAIAATDELRSRVFSPEISEHQQQSPE